MKILLVDDHQLVIAGLNLVLPNLGSNIHIQAETEALIALKVLRNHHDFDLILFDLAMPGMDGLEFLAAIREQRIVSPAVALSATDDLNLILAVLDGGAQGFIPKSHNADQMIAALRIIIDGDIYVPQSLQGQLQTLRHNNILLASKKESVMKEIGITQRQHDVLSMLAKGCSNKETGNLLCLSENTVKSHVAALFKALDASNRTECVRNAYELGIINSIT